MYILLLFTFIQSSIITLFYLIGVLRLLNDAKCCSLNYNSKNIPKIAGVVFIPVVLSSIGIIISTTMIGNYEYIKYMFTICAMGFIGLFDDLLGENAIKGFRNHFRCFLDGKITTGFVKAFFGGIIALIVTVSSYTGFYEAITNFFIIVLFTNTLNLFDLRPGRCAKFFILFAIPIVIIGFRELEVIIPLVIVVSSTIVYMIYDLSEKCMLGDTGSNILGITLGYYSTLVLNIKVKVIILFILVILNIISEKKSFTDIISRSKFLSFFDNLGRSNNP